MDIHKKEYFRGLLIKEKEKVLDTLRRMKEHQSHNASLKEYTEELSSYDNHPADLGTEMFMTSMQINLENNEKYRLKEIERALQRVDTNDYGICRGCGVEIEEERLKIMPEATTCMKCEEKNLPLRDLRHNRPVEEGLLKYPFGRTYKNNEDYTGFDGEDAYQEVAKFNEVKKDPSFSTGDNQGIFDLDSIGTVEEVDKITEGHYKSQLTENGGKRKRREDFE